MLALLTPCPPAQQHLCWRCPPQNGMQYSRCGFTPVPRETNNDSLNVLAMLLSPQLSFHIQCGSHKNHNSMWQPQELQLLFNWTSACHLPTSTNAQGYSTPAAEPCTLLTFWGLCWASLHVSKGLCTVTSCQSVCLIKSIFSTSTGDASHRHSGRRWKY